jgi:ABC-type phosphate/phosphonate transport system substrate-binding protein
MQSLEVSADEQATRRPRFITSHRLYNATPRATRAWAALFTRVFRELGLEVETVAHAWPLPVAELWQRPGLCATFMCGWPYARAIAQGIRFQALAAPVPAFSAYEGRARYRSEFLVRADSGWTRLEDSFGSRYGWMVQDSQSGWNAPRLHLAQYVNASRSAFFSSVKGPYGNPRGLLGALLNGEIDVTAVDGFYLDLMRADDSPALSGLRTVEVTAWTPLPLLVAGGDVDARVASRLRELLIQLHLHADWQHLLAEAMVERFDPVSPAAYQQLLEMEQLSVQHGYTTIR